MFVRGETQSQSVLEAEKEPTVNPDAIDLDSDDDSDEVRNFNQWTLKTQFSIIIISQTFFKTKMMKNLIFRIFLQEQSDKDDEAIGPNDFCELVNNEL